MCELLFFVIDGYGPRGKMGALLNFVLHIDTHLQNLIHIAGAGSYLIIFAFLFAETGFVILPFLPGDSLIFATGALCAKGTSLNLPMLFVVMSAAAIAGDSANFAIGKRIGPKVFQKKVGFLKPENLQRTQAFFKKYGGKTIIIARFVPIVRTFAPFVAGTGQMNYGQFIRYNIVGGLAWVALFLFGGYFFGNLPYVKGHFLVVVAVIVALSAVPALYEVWKARRQ